ncbi:nucleotidyltransferase domain-containing protein [Salmonirosea aquatica]|uniref:Nucleotidyltransferase domain-containing protein n=1 Tax=Salmonirosea aquatica TaxID=2654236 RepID=A0A7C9BG87_9BACT|nr:nucleotidyltransferase domain-containing protein [Cytophagaceae bacterium SJW1-29]
MKPTTKKITNLIRQAINQVDDKAEVILFGSRARGDERKDSDWDILVLTDYPVDLNREHEFRYVLCDLELETAESFSLFVFSKSEWKTKHRVTPFYNSISQEGVRL